VNPGDAGGSGERDRQNRKPVEPRPGHDAHW
jgi:hypothetical protein